MKRVIKISLCLSILCIFAISLISCQSPFVVKLSDNDKLLIEANNDFVPKIFSEIVKKEDSGTNVFISPFSISTALTMAYNGALGDTKDVMADVLWIADLELNEVNKSYKYLVEVMKNSGSDVEISVANSIWGDKHVTFKEDFSLNMNELLWSENWES